MNILVFYLLKSLLLSNIQESETVEQIDRDVKRTHPEMQFFNAGSSDALANQVGICFVQMMPILACFWYLCLV
jgi:hypothetical protein